MSENDPNRSVSAGEYCTLKRAKELGILDEKKFRETAESPYSAEYNTLKTYNAELDAKESRTKTLCKSVVQANANGTTSQEAYPHCVDLHGPGFVKRATNDVETPYKCQLYECPPGFTQSGEFCAKESMYKDADIDKRSKCDERWYDWFTIPNYHLGNKFYEESVGKCYHYCRGNQVPNYATDPVDGSKVGLTSEDKLLQCVPRTEYLFGKYADNSDYCPLAWIHRLYFCNKENVKKAIKDRRMKISEANKDYTTSKFNATLSDEQLNREAQFISNECQRLIENVPFPKDAFLQACNTMNTKERLDEAYTICHQLNMNGDLDVTNPGEPDQMKINRNAVLRQACNAVFCNETVGALDVIGKDPVCFNQTKKIDPNSAATMSEEAASAPMYDENQNFMIRSFRTLILIVVFSIVIMLAWMVFSNFIWPNTRRFFYWFLGLFTGRRYAYVEYKAQAFEDLARARSRAAARGVNLS